ncbi:MAG: phosphate acyltransferase, partial [Emcibacteraceae bacterium]|nr:phosphate acyltransferase [Emcibacteraceae bacterium]
MDIDPNMEQIVESTIAASKQIELFGIKPKVALLSHSNFGSSKAPSAVKMQKAVKLLRERSPGLEVDGEMHVDAALNEDLRRLLIQDCAISGAANLLVFPSLDAANSALGLLKSVERGLLVGPILLGAAMPAHIVTPGISARGIFNMTAIAVKDAQNLEKEKNHQWPI